ncbi:acyltransferase family protein [Paenirhodobacter populi]|uniref:Acyltransferase n=1 Tax=Paenirhodobacter populi TaxID=2306993 RepID=A0A443IPP8_9RHOB|nr:acyltransferase [Sinirhodobacter populi]RWR08163.1 acyltransferase [Sinirhodobacter populi]
MSILDRLFPLNPKREMHVETIRGIACIALVSYHAVGSTPHNGMELAATDWLAILQQCFIDMRMPLFSFVSGYVFVSIARPGRNWLQMLRVKARRLLLPMAAVGTLFWLLRTAAGYHEVPLYRIFFFPYAHFWFLQATFLLMAALLVLNALTAGWRGALTPVQAARNAACLGLGGALLYILSLNVGLSFFSTFQAIHLAPFFMTGHVLGLVGKPLFSKLAERARYPAGIIPLLLLVLLGTWLAVAGVPLNRDLPHRSLSIFIGLGTALSLFVLRPRNRILAWIGDKSYAVYLFHVFFTSATLIAWDALAKGSVDIHWAYLPTLFMGIFGPVLLQAAMLKSPWTGWLFLGLRFPAQLFGRQKTASRLD